MANTEDTTPREWTVMVYMAAGDSHQLDTAAVRDVKEMERGANDHAHIVVQINRHWPKSAQLYEIQKNATLFKRQLAGNTDMGQADTLSDFLTWAVKNYPAKKYFLVLWGHAYGLGFGRDHDDPLTLKRLKDAITAFQQERRNQPWAASDGRLELFGANACAMSYVEAAYELRDSAQYMVASQISVPFSGWPYESILGRITETTKPIDLGRVVVNAYVSQFNDLPGGDRLAMTLLNLDAVTPLGQLLENLATAIDDDVIGEAFNADRLAFFRDVFVGAAAGDVRPLIDLTDLCNDLSGDEIDPIPGPVGDAARALRQAVNPRAKEGLLPSLETTTEGSGESGGLVVHYRRHPELEDLNGVGIFTPFVTDQETLKRLELVNDDSDSSKRKQQKQKLGRDAYKTLDLFTAEGGGYGTEGKWPRLVYDTLRRDIPADLMEFIDGIGAMQQGDRSDVAQIILSIDSSLNKLDRTLANAKRDIVTALTANGHSGNGGAQLANETREFGPPWLRLVQPLDLEAKVANLKQVAEFHALTGKKPKTPKQTQAGATEAVPRYIVNAFVTEFRRVEQAVADVERTTKRGLTHARFGLGPSNPTKISLGFEPPKSGEGFEPPKSGEGFEPPKSGEGEPRVNGGNAVASGSGDLRGDLAVARVADLFRQVGQSLAQLEQATTDVERGARIMLVDSTQAEQSSKYFFAATAQEVQRAFHILEEASTATRRTVRRVLAHPVYGVGPGGKDDLTLDVRQELASRGGLDKRHLRLL